MSTSTPHVSFEFFPPKTDAMANRLWDTVQRLEPMAPDFVSVTYGAGGSTRERTHETVKRIAQETSLKPAGHLTCVSATKAEVLAVAEEYWQAGVKHIVALRGDPPKGSAGFEPHPEGFANSVELIEALAPQPEARKEDQHSIFDDDQVVGRPKKASGKSFFRRAKEGEGDVDPAFGLARSDDAMLKEVLSDLLECKRLLDQVR